MSSPGTAYVAQPTSDAGNIGVIDASSEAFMTFPRMLPGDIADGVVVHLNSVPADVINAAITSVEVYGCNAPPRSVAEARNGRLLFRLDSLMLDVIAIDTVADLWQQAARLAVPMVFATDGTDSYVSVVIVNGGDLGFRCFATLDVFRPDRKREDVSPRRGGGGGGSGGGQPHE